MKNTASLVILVIALSLGVWKYSTSKPAKQSGDDEPSQAVTSKSSRPNSSTNQVHPANSGSDQGTDLANNPDSKLSETQVAAKAAIIEKIHDASTTYDAAYLPVIKPYLLDPDPEIRENAVNAMIVLGDAAAGKMLREAAIQMKTAEDVKMMLEAAEFVELPPADLKKFIKRKNPDGETTPPEKRTPRADKRRIERSDQPDSDNATQSPPAPSNWS